MKGFKTLKMKNTKKKKKKKEHDGIQRRKDPEIGERLGQTEEGQNVCELPNRLWNEVVRDPPSPFHLLPEHSTHPIPAKLPHCKIPLPGAEVSK